MTVCRSSDGFGYNSLEQRCLRYVHFEFQQFTDCLLHYFHLPPPPGPPPIYFTYCSCCHSTASRNVLRSCSNPLFDFRGSPSLNEICPSPPKLSYTAASSQLPEGLLESHNVYIAELLIREAKSLSPDVFFRRFQAGFSLSLREPSHSVCGCTQPDNVCTDSPYISALSTTGESANISRYSFNQICAIAWSGFYLNLSCNEAWNVISNFPGCSDLDFTSDSELQCNGSSSPLGAYRVDGLSSDVLQVRVAATISGACASIGDLSEGDD